MTKSSLGWNAFIWLKRYSVSSGEDKTETQGRNLEAGPEADTIEEGMLLAGFLIHPRVVHPRVALSTGGGALPHQSSIKKMLSRLV